MEEEEETGERHLRHKETSHGCRGTDPLALLFNLTSVAVPLLSLFSLRSNSIALVDG